MFSAPKTDIVCDCFRWVCNRGGFAFDTLDWVVFWMFCSDTRFDGSRSGCCMVGFNITKAKGGPVT